MSINSTNVYSQNSSLIRNTNIQPSQLNGGNIANIFDLQVLRTIKGRVELNKNSPPQYYTVLNDYDSSPVALGSNDFIIGYGVGNGNKVQTVFNYNVLDFVSGLNNPNGVAIDPSSTYIYVVNNGYGTISKIDVVTRSIVSASWVSGLSNPIGLVIDSTGTYIYVTNSGDNSISKIEISTGVVVNPNWVTGLNFPFALVIDQTGTYMYVTNSNGNSISQIEISTGVVVNPSFVTGLNNPTGMVIYSEILYIINSGNFYILQINPEIIFNLKWLEINYPSLGLAIEPTGTYMYACGGTIFKINILNGTLVSTNWVAGLFDATVLVIDSNGIYMYATLSFSGSISKILISTGTLVDLNWVTGQFDSSLVIDPNDIYIYAGVSYGNSISKILISTGTVVDPNWVVLLGVSYIYSLAIDPNGIYMYALVNNGTSTISKILISTGTVVDPNWITGLNYISGVAIDPTGTYMYVTYVDASILKIEILTASVVDTIGGLLNSYYIVIDRAGNYMYTNYNTFNYGDNSITKIQLQPIVTNYSWTVGLNSPSGLAIDPTGNSMYVTNSGNGVISQINFVNGSVNNSQWLTGLDNPNGIIIDSNGLYMYVTNSGNGNISRIVLNNKESLTGTAPVTPINNSPEIKFITNPIPPEYSSITNLWIPQNPTGLAVQTVTPIFTTGNVNQSGLYINSGYGQFGSIILNSCGITCWLQMIQTENSFTVENGTSTPGAINITLIILTI